MASKVQIDQVEKAIVDLGRSYLTAAYEKSVDVDSIGDRDFNADGDLVLLPPCVRVRFGGSQYDTNRDNQKLTYGAKLLFDFYCFEENLRSKLDERIDTLRLVACVQDAYTGARLKLDDDSYTEPLELVGVLPMMNENSIVDQFYSVTIRVNGIAQFSGANSNWGTR